MAELAVYAHTLHYADREDRINTISSYLMIGEQPAAQWEQPEYIGWQPRQIAAWPASIGNRRIGSKWLNPRLNGR
jgi:hypothetical protein